MDVEAHSMNDAIRLDFKDLIEDLWVVADVTHSVILFANSFNVTVKLVLLLLKYIVTCEWASSITWSVILMSRGFSLKQIMFESYVKAKKQLWYKTFHFMSPLNWVKKIFWEHFGLTLGHTQSPFLMIFFLFQTIDFMDTLFIDALGVFCKQTDKLSFQ